VSYRQQVAAEVEPWIGAHLGDVESGRRALRRLGLNEDTLRPCDLTARYALALLPLGVALDAADVSALAAFVQAGGVLVIGPLAGHRCVLLHGPDRDEPPGALRSLTGTANGEGTTLDEPAMLSCRRSGASIESTRYAEILEPRAEGGEVLAEHARGWFTGSAAVMRRQLGAGSVIHSGVALNDAVLTWLLREHLTPLLAAVAAPVHVSSAAAEVLTRRHHSTALHFVLNHGPEPVACERLRPASDLLDGSEVPTRFELPAYGYRILREAL
jgi:beta-galactosidase